MPAIEPKDKSLKSLTGFHLWHAPMSSCSQRVRILLSEVGREYESHLIDLERNEHTSEGYQNIHPNGVVPAFVDDGTLIIESIDIIKHIARVSDISLGEDPDGLLALVDGSQTDLKLLTYEFLFRAKPRSDAVNEAFRRDHRNEWLKKFRDDFARGFAEERIDAAVTRTFECFQTVDKRLADGRPFLSGDQFSLSDIAWMPNVHRMSLMGWPFELTPHLNAWFARMKERPSYRAALLDWQSDGIVAAFLEYTDKRRTSGTDISAFGALRDLINR